MESLQNVMKGFTVVWSGRPTNCVVNLKGTSLVDYKGHGGLRIPSNLEDERQCWSSTMLEFTSGISTSTKVYKKELQSFSHCRS